MPPLCEKHALDWSTRPAGRAKFTCLGVDPRCCGQTHGASSGRRPQQGSVRRRLYAMAASRTCDPALAKPNHRIRRRRRSGGRERPWRAAGTRCGCRCGARGRPPIGGGERGIWMPGRIRRRRRRVSRERCIDRLQRSVCGEGAVSRFAGPVTALGRRRPRQRGPGRRVSPTVRFRSAGVSTSRRCRCVRAGFDAMPLTAQGARMRCEGWLAAGQQRGIPERPKPCSASARPGSAARCGLATRRCRPPRSPGRSAGGRRDPCGPRGRATPPSGPRGRPRGRAS